jgi:hypothetical protein
VDDERFNAGTVPRTEETGAERPDSRDEIMMFPSVKHDGKIRLSAAEFQP